MFDAAGVVNPTEECTMCTHTAFQCMALSFELFLLTLHLHSLMSGLLVVILSNYENIVLELLRVEFGIRIVESQFAFSRMRGLKSATHRLDIAFVAGIRDLHLASHLHTEADIKRASCEPPYHQLPRLHIECPYFFLLDSFLDRWVCKKQYVMHRQRHQ